MKNIKEKAGLTLALFFLLFHSNAQLAKAKKIGAENGAKSWAITIKGQNDSIKTYWASCYFSPVSALPDRAKIELIGSIFEQISDTSYCSHPVTAISYRYNGRFNKKPQSHIYNIQVAALMLINYLAFNSKAVEYSPFPVLYDTLTHREISTTGPGLDAIIGDYKIWFKQVKDKGFVDYSFPLTDGRYQWYGTLCTQSRTFKKMPQWSKFYDCPLLAKEEDK